MSKLHYCINGESVTDQVITYQNTRESSDYLWIQMYYDNYKDHWYYQLSDYMDRIAFESDYDFKLSRAVDTFSGPKAATIAKQKGYARLGAFNGWFYKILANWKSNVKTSSFRLKKRPSVQCPVCGRFVARIDSEHLQHYKSVKDIPKFFVWKGDIYEVRSQPNSYANTWGSKTFSKWKDLQAKETKSWTNQRRRVVWPWKLKNGEKGVVCPFTKKFVPQIDEVYIRSLDNKHSRYAAPISWEQFVEDFPRSRIQSEVYDLGHVSNSDNNTDLSEKISRDWRIQDGPEVIDYERIQKGNIPIEYEHVFSIIDLFTDNLKEQDILKLVSIGYSFDDIVDTLDVDKKEVKICMKTFRSNDELKDRLQEV